MNCDQWGTIWIQNKCTSHNSNQIQDIDICHEIIRNSNNSNVASYVRKQNWIIFFQLASRWQTSYKTSEVLSRCNTWMNLINIIKIYNVVYLYQIKSKLKKNVQLINCSIVTCQFFFSQLNIKTEDLHFKIEFSIEAADLDRRIRISKSDNNNIREYRMQ